jgi:DNA-binding transcriptional ArsR family regulator
MSTSSGCLGARTFFDTNILLSEDSWVDSLTFAALVDPNRLQIVEMLRDGPASVGEIAERLVFRQPQTSKHSKTLADAGLIRVQPVAQRRVYELRPASPMCRIDLRVGGSYVFCMRAPQNQGGQDSFTAGVYQRIVPNEVLAFTQFLSNAPGNPVAPGELPPGFPTSQLHTLTFRSAP